MADNKNAHLWTPELEADWRAGTKSKMALATEYGVSRAAMDKHYRPLGITRDLSAKIASETAKLVEKQAVTPRLSYTKSVTSDGVVSYETKVEPVTDSEIISSNAKVKASVILGQRKDIQRYVNLAQSLLAELEVATGDKELFSELGEILRAPDEKGMDKLNDIYKKVISLPGRVSSFKLLGETLKTLIGLERQAFGLSDNSNGEADKPPASPGALNEDTARRIAYILLKAERGL